jgi:thiol-disulfide isomerase/thioredoxin
MRKTMKYILSFMFMLGVISAIAQQKETPPVIGEQLPDFSFDIRYGDKGVSKASALRGKPVMFIFFGKGCHGSFQGLPKINALYKKFKNRMNFIGMATTSRENVKESYERYRTHYRLEFPVAIDSVVYKQLSIYAFSTLVLVDASGIVKAVTYMISEEAIEQFLNGEPFFFHDISQKSKQEKRNTFDVRKPAFVNGNGGEDNEFLQRSLISEWKPGMARTTLLPFYNG